jgi:citrate lyase alpha subunit
MIDLIFINNILIFDEIEYSITEISKNDDFGVTIFLSGVEYQFYYTFRANDVTINGVLQTSADMIINTLTLNGQS